MAINFPDNPTPNDIHTESSLGKSWKWDGTTWLIYSSSTTGIGYSDLSVTTEAAQGGGSLTYNQANGQFTFKPSAGGGGGATNFTGLGDTPSSLNAGKWLKVNTGGTALEWTDAPTGNDTNDYLNTASLSGTTLTLTRTGTQSLSNVTVDLSSLNSVPTTITVANESTETVCYPLFTTTATGNLEPKTVTSFKLNSSSGQLEAGSFKKTGGSASEFLKADGSVDSNTYTNVTYSIEALASPGIQLLDDGNPGASNRVFFDGLSGISVARKTGTTNTIEFSASLALNDLSNVDAVTGAANGKILKYNGTSWEVADDNASGGGGGATTINSNADNRIITGSASANTLNAESSLTYDGTKLNFADDKKITFGNNLRMEIYTDGSTNYIKTPSDGSSPGAFPISIHSGSSEVINIDDGNTQIKTGLKDKDGDLGTAGQILSSTGTQVNWIDAAGGGTNTTYDLAAAADSGNATITLTGSDSSEDVVTLSGGGGISYAVTGNTVQISSANSLGGLTDTNISGSPTDNYVLTYDLASSTWEPQPVPSGSTPNLNDVLGAGNTSTLAATVGNLTCSNLTVNGTTTTVNSNTVNIGDSNITLNSDEAGAPSQDGGLTIERGTSDNVEIRWNETTDKWQYTNDGSNYSDIGSSNSTYTDTDVDTHLNQSNPTSGHVLSWNGSDYAWVAQTTNTTLNLIDEDDMSSNSATRPPSQQSVKAYVDANSSSADGNDYLNAASFSGNTLTLGRTGSLADLTVNIGTITGVPTGTILMYNGDTAPAGWCLCDGVTRTINNSSYTPPDLRDRFIVGAGNNYTRADQDGSADAVVVSHDHGSGNTGDQSANHSHGSGNYSGNASTHNGHTHGDGNYGTSTHNGHSHGSGNYSGNASTHNGHTHGQSGSGSGNTGNQSANHYHTIGGSTTDGSPAKWNVNTSGGGTHGHSYRESNGHPQSNMAGIQRSGGDSDNATNNTDILSSGGSHNHSINLTGVTTGGIDQNHTHNFSFNVSGNTTYASIGDHAHNVTGSSGNQSSNHNHNVNIVSEGSSGSGRNLPPYYAITFIMKT